MCEGRLDFSIIDVGIFQKSYKKMGSFQLRVPKRDIYQNFSSKLILLICFVAPLREFFTFVEIVLSLYIAVMASREMASRSRLRLSYRFFSGYGYNLVWIYSYSPTKFES